MGKLDAHGMTLEVIGFLAYYDHANPNDRAMEVTYYLSLHRHKSNVALVLLDYKLGKLGIARFKWFIPMKDREIYIIARLISFGSI